VNQTTVISLVVLIAVAVVTAGYLLRRIRRLEDAHLVGREVQWQITEQHGHELDALAKRVKELEVTK
jgi:HAMP domain-containing protein